MSCQNAAVHQTMPGVLAAGMGVACEPTTPAAGVTVVCSGGNVADSLYQEDVACSWRVRQGSTTIIDWTPSALVRQVEYPFLAFFTYTAAVGPQASHGVTMSCCSDRNLPPVVCNSTYSGNWISSATVAIAVNSVSRRRRGLTGVGLERQQRLAAAAASSQQPATQQPAANQGWGGGWQPDVGLLKREIQRWKEAQQQQQQQQQQQRR
jgi:hypothetical protein